MGAARLTESAKSLRKQLKWPDQIPPVSLRATARSSDISTCSEHDGRSVTLWAISTLRSLQQPSPQWTPGLTASLRSPPSHRIPSSPSTPSPWCFSTWGANPAPLPHHPKGAARYRHIHSATTCNCAYSLHSGGTVSSPVYADQEKTKDQILASILNLLQQQAERRLLEILSLEGRCQPPRAKEQIKPSNLSLQLQHLHRAAHQTTAASQSCQRPQQFVQTVVHGSKPAVFIRILTNSLASKNTCPAI